MGRNDGVEVRKERITKVCEMILASLYANKEKGEVLLDLILADIQVVIGLTEKRIMEYAAIGEKRGLFVIDIKNNRIKKPQS